MKLHRGPRSGPKFNVSFPQQMVWLDGHDNTAMISFYRENDAVDRGNQYAIECTYEDAITILELIRDHDPRAAELLGDPPDSDDIKRELGLID